MVKTFSNMLELGTLAPQFCLPNVIDQKNTEIKKGYAATLIFFICNHCPYVKHIQEGLIQLAQDYIPKNVQFIAINSNDATQYPEDSPAHMAEIAQTLHYPFPYLYDETQEVAKAYQAACTPDFFLYGPELALVYRGQFDDSRPGSMTPVTGQSLRDALDQLLRHEPVDTHQKPSIGCNIKWKDSL